jgi:acyl carrier protein
MHDTIELQVTSIWAQILGVEKANASASFYELGGTSIMAEQIAARIEEALAVKVTGIDVLRDHQLGDLVQTVRTKLGGR